jgi:phosphoribosylaminoimidazolecarboxamide formyltransferase/IMP cyclohydrolase
MNQLFLEVVVARSIDPGAATLFAKKKNLRVITIPEAHWNAPAPSLMGVWTNEVALIQDDDTGFPELEKLETVTSHAPAKDQMLALRMAWKVAKHVKSNAIVVADADGTVGIGAGQMSRVDSSHLAVRKAGAAGLKVDGAVAASDAFFPFPDGLLELAKSGISAVIQPGGSIRDEEVIAAANEANLAMVFTGRRHFRHL